MEIIAVADAVTLATAQNLGFAKFLVNRHFSTSSGNQVSVISDVYSRISSGLSPVDAVAPPTIRQNLYRSVPRTLSRKKRRTRRRSLTGDSDDGEENGFFGDGDDGPFGGGGGSFGGGGGSGWNFGGGYGGSNWEESSSSSSSSSDPAFDFVYEVLSWIVLSNCVHFAFKKIVRTVIDGISDPSREKVVPMRLVSVC